LLHRWGLLQLDESKEAFRDRVGVDGAFETMLMALTPKLNADC
jgi:hypothetical protein